MDKEEIIRLKEGEKLMRQISTIEKQIESLKKVKFICLGTSKEVKISFDRYYLDDKTIEKVVDYNIPLNVDDKTPHPFAEPSLSFVKTLINLMNEKQMLLQKQFDAL